MGKASRDVKTRYRTSRKGRETDLRRLDRLRELTAEKRVSYLAGPLDCEWRPIPGFDDYEVSEYGDVRRATPSRTRAAGHILKASKCQGYRRYKLVCDGIKINIAGHRLVALAFHGQPPSSDHQVAHWDGDRTNNHYTNLRWATVQENAHDRVRHGSSRGVGNGRAKLTDDDVREIRRRHALSNERGVAMDLCREFGLTSTTVYDIIHRRHWSHVR